jgi:hypothetical protein
LRTFAKGPVMSMFVTFVLDHGEVPESFESGPSFAKSLCSMMDNLDSIARGIGLKPLVDFEVDYSEEVDEILADENVDVEQAMNDVGKGGPWYEPGEGLVTVRGLIGHLQGLADAEQALPVLRSLERELEYAKETGSGFHLSFTE